MAVEAAGVVEGEVLVAELVGTDCQMVEAVARAVTTVGEALEKHSLPLPSSTPAGTTPGQPSDSSYPMIPPMSTY